MQSSTLCCLILAVLRAEASVNLLHSIQLDPDVVVHWTPENETNSVTIQVEARTRGWAAIGFSPTGGMAGADIVMAWVTDGQVHIQDMHAVGNSVPLLDHSSDIHLLDGYENATHTVFTFHRPLRSCDTEHDLQLGVDTTRLIWALHPADPPAAGAPSYHGSRRGVRSVSLDGSGTFQFPKAGESESFIIRNVDTHVSNEGTHYHCEIHKLPDFGQKVHYTGFRVHLDPATAPYVHHMAVYLCSAPRTLHGFFEEYARSHPGAKCFSPNMPPHWSLCQFALLVWIVGSEGEMLPEDIGIPIRDTDASTYVMMETHYDNPTLIPGMRDNTGLELFFTRTLRPMEAGVLTIGHIISATQLIPPGQRRFTTGSVCSAECTEKAVPSEGVQVLSVLLHGHLAARAIRVRHIRAGRELPPLIEDKYYDFNYQQSRRLHQTVRIMPGDDLIVECDYETQDRTNVTMGGFSTSHEMCFALITHYPRLPISFCDSRPQIGDFLQSMDVQWVNVDGETMPSVSGADFWTFREAGLQAAFFTEALDGNSRQEAQNEASRSQSPTQRDVDSHATDLKDMLVSVEGDTPNVSLFDYLTNLHWDRRAIDQMQRTAWGGRIYHRCLDYDSERLKDFRNYLSGPSRYPEFEPWVPDETSVCAEEAKSSAADPGTTK